jgi:uncharacterized membrane protein YebE (DUF533 family)
MNRLVKSISVVLLLFCFCSSISFAQQQSQEMHKKNGPRRQLATIIFAGIGGAILGLSTLSFYGRPQDQLSNIAIGFAIGTIAGTAYVTFKSATSPRDYYDEPPPKDRQSQLYFEKQDPHEKLDETNLVWAPLVQKQAAGWTAAPSTSLGGQLLLAF